MIGKHISNYYITEQLGEGGMGTVYRATDKYLERTVALKMLHPFLTKDPDYFKRFRNEAYLSAKISHPNVATLYNFEESDQHHFIVMEYVNGAPLDKVLKLQGKLPEQETVKIILQILEGLGAAHDLGIMHRDLKPGNIIINTKGYVKLMDFGIARLETAERLTQQNSVIGTLEYLAPELVKGESPSKQSDLYAVGVMMHEMLSGQTLYHADSEAALMYQIAHVAPNIRLPEVSPKLVRILKKLTHKVPQKRYTNTSEVIRDLEQMYLPGKVNTSLLTDKIVHESIQASTPWNTLPKKVLSTITAWRIPTVKHVQLPFDIDIRIIAIAAILSLLILIVGLIPLSREQGTSSSSLAETDNLTTVDDPLTSLPSMNTLTDGKTPVPVIPFEEGEGPQPPDRPQKEEEPLNRPKQHVIKPVENTPTDQGSSSQSNKTTQQQSEQKSPTRESGSSDISAESEENKQDKATEDQVVQQDEQSFIQEKPVNTISLTIPEINITARFSKTLSSEKNHQGEIVYLRNTRPVYYGNHLIVNKDARVRAQVVKLRSGAQKKRAFLGIQLIAVEAVNGQWLELEFPEYSNVAKDKVEFEQGRTLNNVIIAETSLTINIP